MAKWGKRKTKQVYVPMFWPLYKLITYLIYSLLLHNSQKLLIKHKRRGKGVITIYLLGGGILVLILVVIILAFIVPKARSARQRKALEQILERYHQSGQALVRYVMLNRQCSENAAFKRIATFVKNHVPLDDHSSIDRMLTYDRQDLLDSAHSILAHDPDEIDKI